MQRLTKGDQRRHVRRGRCGGAGLWQVTCHQFSYTTRSVLHIEYISQCHLQRKPCTPQPHGWRCDPLGEAKRSAVDRTCFRCCDTISTRICCGTYAASQAHGVYIFHDAASCKVRHQQATRIYHAAVSLRGVHDASASSTASVSSFAHFIDNCVVTFQLTCLHPRWEIEHCVQNALKQVFLTQRQ